MLNDNLDGVFCSSKPFECNYIPGRQAQSNVFIPARPGRFILEKAYNQLINEGFRRGGEYLFRPQCDGCQACISVRIVVGQFRPDRSQRRIWNKNRHLNVQQCKLIHNPCHLALYHNYQLDRHDPHGTYLEHCQQYREFILTSRVNTMLFEFSDLNLNRLKIVSIVDTLADGLSAVYTFYDVENMREGLGVYAILYLIQHAVSLGLPYLYLGYWVEQNQKMSYKIRYQPLEKLNCGVWQSFDFNDRC